MPQFLTQVDPEFLHVFRPFCGKDVHITLEFGGGFFLPFVYSFEVGVNFIY